MWTLVPWTLASVTARAVAREFIQDRGDDEPRRRPTYTGTCGPGSGLRLPLSSMVHFNQAQGCFGGLMTDPYCARRAGRERVGYDSCGSEPRLNPRREVPDTDRPYTPSGMLSAVQHGEKSRLSPNLVEDWDWGLPEVRSRISQTRV